MEQALIARARELRHELHAHPELSGCEVQTKARLIQFLKEHAPAFELLDRGNRFMACLRAPVEVASNKNLRRRSIAFRADMDALPIDETVSLPWGSKTPGVSHKCGHDGHCAALCALALELQRRTQLGKRFNRDIYLVFQPAEEIGAGGETCARDLLEEGIGCVYACHNWHGFDEGTVVLREGIAQCASCGLKIRLTGTCAHAAEPSGGVNPARALAELVLQADSLCRQDPLVLATVVGLQAGEGDFGIAAWDGVISLTLRAEHEEDLRDLRTAILNLASQAAECDGLALTCEDVDIFPETRNHALEVDVVRRAAHRIGLETIELDRPLRPSEDFGYYLKLLSGAIFYLGNGREYPALHTQAYDFVDANIERAAELFLALCDLDDSQ